MSIREEKERLRQQLSSDSQSQETPDLASAAMSIREEKQRLQQQQASQETGPPTPVSEISAMDEKDRLRRHLSSGQEAPTSVSPLASSPMMPSAPTVAGASSLHKTASGRTVPPGEGTDALVSDGFIVPSLEAEANNEAPPAYGEVLDQVQFTQPGIEAGAEVTGDGRVNININTKTRRLADLLGPAIANQVSMPAQPSLPPAYIPASLGGVPGQTPPPQLNLVIQIVGSRGDVQPFVALGKVLRDTYGHRVRIATHPTFQTFVEENGLEFFSIGGDPAELMAFMVKHPGLMPGFDAIKSGEVSKRRRGISEILLGCWRSCIEAGNGLGPPPKFQSKDEPLNVEAGMPGDTTQEPFVADAIIANPPSFAHIHVAEKLGIPLHMMFTMPWTPTKAFPHPLANIQSSNADDVMTNYLTYTLVEMMTWHGLGDIINRFREKALDLEPLSAIWAPGLLSRLKISYTYCWSPALIPKPNDWGSNVDISGFFFLDLANTFTPDPDLAAFLEAGPPPVYIGFGSIVVDDPNALTRMIFDTVHTTGCRALVSKGWGGLGADDVGLPEGVFMLGNVPHDWLFQHVSAVVHHGGAGTTAAGIKAGKPTFVVPFFGDQPFWGAMIAKAGAGPAPVGYKNLTSEKLAEALEFCSRTETIERALELGQKISQEKGADTGGQSFHSHLHINALRCSVAPSRTAVWRVRRTNVRLSALAAAVLVDQGLLEQTDLKLYRSMEYNTEDQPPDPISACAFSLISSASSIGMEVADMPRELFRTTQKLKQDDESDSQAPKDEGLTRSDTGATEAAIAGDSTAELAATVTRSSTETTLGGDRTPPVMSPSLNDSSSTIASPRPIRTATGSTSESSNTRASGSAMKQAFQRRPSSPAGVGLEAALGASKGVGRIVSHGVKSPMNFCLGCAKGFRNIPRLYNDDTVRPVEKVTGIQSGIKIASKEFGYGLFDGITGLFTQPIRGAEKDLAAGGFARGAGGLVKGFGKGVGGLITKPAAGFWGIPAYLMQGVHAETRKFFTRSVQNYIVMSRITQGQHDQAKATAEERDDIAKRWNNIKFELRNIYSLKRKEKATDNDDEESTYTIDSGLRLSKSRTEWLHSRQLSFDERKSLQSQKNAQARRLSNDGPIPTSIANESSASLATTNTANSTSRSSTAEDAEYEQAIVAAVQETSRGIQEEDAAIEAAIRHSVRTMRERGGLPEPIAELPEVREKNAQDPNIFDDDEFRITDTEYQELVEKAIQQSMAGQEGGIMELDDTSAGGTWPSYSEAHDEDDEQLRRAIAESQQPTLPARSPPVDDEAEMARAIAASQQEHQRKESQKTEEEIVMEYVMKQSLAEAELRKKYGKGKERVEEQGADDDDEDLRRAMEESLQLSRGDASGPSGV